MKKRFQKIIVLVTILLLSKSSFAQENSLSQINEYWTNAKTILNGGNNVLKIQLNQNTIDVLDRIVPKISSSGINGGINEISAILFEKKSIKYLDPEFRNNMFAKCNILKQAFQSKADIIIIATSIVDLGTFIYNFIDTAYPQACETNNTGKIVLINTSNIPCDVTLNDNLLTRVDAKSQSTSFVLPSGENQKLYAIEATKFFPKKKVYSISIATCSTRKYSIPN